IAFVAVSYAISEGILLQGFARVEEGRTGTDVERALSALDTEISNLDAIAHDWAAWDDSYAFIQDRNQEYLQANVVDSTFTRLRLNLTLYADATGQVVFARGFDFNAEQEMPVSQGLQEYLAENGALLRFPNEESGVSGIIMLPEGPMLVASRPILTSEGEGPMRGALLMGRYLDPQETRRIGDVTHLSLSLHQLTGSPLSPQLQAARSSLLKGETTFVQAVNKDIIAGYGLLRDISGNPALILKIEQPRDIYQEGVASAGYLILALTAVVLLSGVSVVLLVEKLVLSRLRQLNASVAGIGSSDTSTRVSVAGNDEISSLAESINDMLERIEKSLAALRDSEERYRLLVNNASEAIIVIQDLMIVYANPWAAKLSGYPLDQPLYLTKLVHPDDRPLAAERHLQRIKGEKVPETYTIRIVDSRGNTRWVEISAVFINWRGKPATLVFLKDVTEYRQAEEALRQSEERFRVAAESISDLIWEWNVKDGTLLWFGDIDGILGYQPGEFPRTLKAWEKAVHPDDHDWVMEALQRGADGIAPYDVKYRVLRKDGSIRYWTDRGTATITDEDGHAQVMVGACSDVTAHELAMEALQKSEERYRTVLDEIEDNYFEVDLAGNMTFANDASSRTLGYTQEELMEMNYRVFIAEEHRESLYRSFNTVYLTGKMLKGVSYDIVRKDGSRGTGEFAISLRRNEKGEAIGFRGIGHDITERKKAEKALKKSEEKYRTILEQVQDSYFEVDLAGKMTFCNDTTCRELGYAREELIGADYKAYVAPEDADMIFKTFNTVYQTGTTSRTDTFKIIRKGGTTIFGETWVSPLRDDKGKMVGFRGLSRNITERVKNEEALRRSEERYRTILEEIGDGYFETDLDGNFTQVNDSQCRLLGYSKEELIGANYGVFIPPEKSRTVFKAYNHMYRTGEPLRDFIDDVIRKDGSHGFAETAAFPIRNENGEIIGFRGVRRDITERMRLEEARKELEFKSQMASRLATVGEMAAGIAHEINNPLTGVIGYAQFLMQEELPDRVKKDVEMINEGAQRVAGIVKRLLAFARQTKPQRDFVNINDIISTTLDLRAYHLKTSNIKVTTQLDPDLPITVGDGGQLQQVFLNLIINAEAEMKAAHGKGKLLIKTEKTKDNIRISFKDDGPGIARENLEKIFNPFFTTRQVGEGTGLGLSICYGIVTEHGGKIWAESKAGKGATFIVELPIIIEPEQLPLAETPEPETPAASKARILVVDDEATVRELLKRTLEEEGHEVECVDNAEDALELVQKKRYRLILLDIKMPGMSGTELYRRMEKITRSLLHRVVFVTGDVLGTRTQEFLRKTKARYIAKPFNVAEMKKEINQILAEG
ncbi:MAG: PAS domain S-box protein, partial [Chloroflexi bacterium]|nr:PAS domain S-box protein [Chloroflexota bacterium]